MVDHVFELVPEVLECTLHRPRRSIAKAADGVTFDPPCDIEQQSELLAARLAGENPLHEPVHPPGPLAARCALTARLGLVETGDPLQDAHHAGGLVHHDYTR